MLSTNFTRKDSIENVGNVLRASKDLNPRDVVLSEAPLIIGPNHRPIPVCLECLRFILNTEAEKCPKCQWSLCQNCQNIQEKLNWHNDVECRMLSDFSEHIYEAIFPLRHSIYFGTVKSKLLFSFGIVFDSVLAKIDCKGHVA